MKKIAAVIYPDEEYPMLAFAALVNHCRAKGMIISGVLQYRAFEGGDHRCDVVLEDLASGHRTPLFESRGADARGCRLDQAALVEVAARIEGSLDLVPDLLILNKFGKVECDGGGLRDLIAGATDRNIAVTIGVPTRNLPQWREFAGNLSDEILSHDLAALKGWATGKSMAMQISEF